MGKLDHDKKPTIYICIEIKNREYDSQILLAASAVLRGYRVYLGTHAAIYALIKNKKNSDGILLDKSMQPRNRLLWNRERVEFYCVLDAELSPVLVKPMARKALPSRIYPMTMELVDRFLVVGPDMDSVAKEYFGERSHSVRMTGWPRIDIWRKYGSLIYRDEIAHIREKFGEYLLFASSFGNIRNPEHTKNLSNADQIQETELNTFESMMQQYLNFKETIKVLRSWDSNENIPPIVVRPHTSEPISVWKKELGKLNKTFIEDNGDIAPWIIASEGLIHNGSTAAVQAFFADKPVFILQEATNVYVLPISSSVSEYILDRDSDFSIFDFSAVKSNSDYEPDILGRVIFNPPNGAIACLIGVFDDLAAENSNRHARGSLLFSQLNRRSFRRAIGLVRDEIYWKFGKTNMNSQLHFVPWGLDGMRIKMVMKVESGFSEVKYRRMTINLWEFEGKSGK